MSASRRPNVFIIGAAKSGTTSLHHYLNSHPQAFGSPIKETCHFLDHRVMRRWHPNLAARRKHLRSEKKYLRLFQDAEDEAVIFESTPHYTAWPIYSGVAERIAKFRPEARLVYIIRDPVERALSEYRYAVNQGRESGPPAEVAQYHPFIVAPSRYATQLKQYLTFFPTDNIKTLMFEDLVQDPDRVVAELFDWLGIDPMFRPPDLGIRYNESPRQLGFVQGDRLLYRIRRSYAWGRVRRWMPQPLRTAARLLSERRARRVDISEIDMSDAIFYLRSLLREEVQELEEILGRRFPQWTTFHGDTAHGHGSSTRSFGSGADGTGSATLKPSWSRGALGDNAGERSQRRGGEAAHDY